MKTLAVAAGVLGAVALSQLPEYTQQYKQRLSGAVKELSWVAAQFDADAAGLGLTRDEALEKLGKSGEMGKARARSVERILNRHDRLSRDLAALNNGSSLYAPANLLRLTEPQLAQDTMADFKPAVPLHATGLAFAGFGFFAGFGLFVGLWSLLSRLQRRQSAAMDIQ